VALDKSERHYQGVVVLAVRSTDKRNAAHILKLVVDKQLAAPVLPAGMKITAYNHLPRLLPAQQS
jgi:hypothetical protein